MSIKMFAVAACLLAVAVGAQGQRIEAVFDVFYEDPQLREQLPPDVVVKASSVNANKVVKGIDTPCFKVEPTNKGWRFIQADKGYVAEKCTSPGCFKLRSSTSADVRKWRPYKCVDKSKKKRCWKLTKCECTGKYKWIPSQFGLQFKQNTNGGGVVSIESCPNKCFNFERCDGKTPCYDVAWCTSPAGETNCRRPVPCDYEEPTTTTTTTTESTTTTTTTSTTTTTTSTSTSTTTTTTKPCQNLVRFQRAVAGIRWVEADEGVRWRKCPNHAGQDDCVEILKCSPNDVNDDGTRVKCYRREPCKSEDPDKPECIEVTQCDDKPAPCENLVRFVRVDTGFQWSPVNGAGVRIRKCPNQASGDCLEILKCDPDLLDENGNRQRCVERVPCKSDATTGPQCLAVEKCDEPCNGFKLVRVDVGFGLKRADKGIRFQPCNADATCLTAVDDCVATSANTACVEVVPNCKSDNQACYRREPC